MPENAVLIDERLEASPLGSILQEYVVSDFKLSMWIPSELAGRVIGKKGVVITNLQRETKAKLINALPPVGDTLWIAVVIIGTMKSIIAACEAISDMVDGEVDDVVLEFTINYRKPFFLSGGSKFGILKRISADTQIRIFFPEFDAKETAYNQAQPVTLEGTCENAQKAVRMFEREALVFQQLQEDDVAQHGRVSQVAHTAAHSPASTTTAAVREGRKDGKTNSHDDATAITTALLGTRAEVSAVSNAVTEDSCPKPKKETVEKIVAIPSNLVGLLMSKRPPIKKTIINTIQKYTHTSISKMAPVVAGGVSSEGAVTAAVRDPGGVVLEEEGSVETAAIGRVDGSNAGGDDNSDGGGSGDESDDDDLSGAQTASQGRSRSSSDSSSSCGSQARNRRRRRCAGAASDEEDEEEEEDDDDDDDDVDEVDADDDSDDGGDDNDEEENEDFAGAGDAAAAEAEQFAMSAEDSIEPVCIETSHPTNLTGESAKGVAADILETLVTAAIAASPSGHAAATTSRNSSSTAANGDEVEPVLFYVRGTLQENVDAVVKSIQQIVDGVRINEVLRALRERSIAFGKSSIHHAKKSAKKKRTVKGASGDVAKRKSAERKQRKDLAKDGDGDHAAAVGEAAGEAAVGKRKSFRGGRKSREQEQRTLEHTRRGGGNATGGVVGASIAGEKAYAAKLSHRRGGAPAARKRSGGRGPPPAPLRSQGTATASGAGSAAAEWSRGGRATTTATTTAVVSIDKKKTAEAAASSAPVSGGAPSMGTFVKRTST